MDNNDMQGVYLVGLVVLQPVLQVNSVGTRIKAALLEGLQVPGGQGCCSHHCMKCVIDSCRVLVGPLVLWTSTYIMSQNVTATSLY